MKKLTIREIIVVASMLFGMFFGAGNLIFPVSMGQLSGSNMWQAAAGFLIPGVGLPLLGVCCTGDQPSGRAAGAEQPGGQKVRPFLHVCTVSDDRPFFCHSQMCHCVIHGRSGGNHGRCFPYSRTYGLFVSFFCACPVFLAAAGGDHDMDRKSAQSSVPSLFGDSACQSTGIAGRSDP